MLRSLEQELGTGDDNEDEDEGALKLYLEGPAAVIHDAVRSFSCVPCCVCRAVVLGLKTDRNSKDRRTGPALLSHTPPKV